MKYMGIDFGSKRIGLAIADEDNFLALPYKVIPNLKDVVSEVVKEIQQKEITHVVVGESKDYKGVDNLIMKDIRIFAHKLKEVANVPVYYEPEFMTSAHAEKTQGKHDLLDASSAALILQSFIDKAKNGGLPTEI